MLRLFFTVVFSIHAAINCFAAHLLIDERYYNIDDSGRLILINAEVSVLNQAFSGQLSQLYLDDTFTFDQPVAELVTGKQYVIHRDSITYRLYFTELPVIRLSTNHTIVDEPRVYSVFQLRESNGRVTNANMGIEHRGAYSLNYPKKSYRLECWADTAGRLTRDISFLDMRSDDDWNLNAMYNEALRFNGKSANELWQHIHQIHYHTLEPSAQNGIKLRYVELFLNDRYQGIYALTERVDRKQLQLKTTDAGMRGELYKTFDHSDAARFLGAKPYDNTSEIWDGIEWRYPDDQVDWENLYQLVRKVAKASNTDFYETYPYDFEKSNLVDYFIFLNVLRGFDNTGKNIYIARYDQQLPYFFVPWDLDGTFGAAWDGSFSPYYENILSNGLFQRLWQDCYPDGFMDQLQNRWTMLRQTVLEEAFVKNILWSNYQQLLANGVYERESIAWPEFSYNARHIQEVLTWVDNRLRYLDREFSKPCVPAGVVNNQNLVVAVYPNPTRDLFYVELGNRVGQEVLQLSLFGMNGQEILRRDVQDARTVLSVGDLPDGMYLLNINGSEYTYHQRLIVAR